jgi:hypothetical protein
MSVSIISSTEINGFLSNVQLHFKRYDSLRCDMIGRPQSFMMIILDHDVYIQSGQPYTASIKHIHGVGDNLMLQRYIVFIIVSLK